MGLSSGRVYVMPDVETMETLDDSNNPLKKHIHEFKTQGFTVFPKTFDETWMQRAREIFEETVNRIPYQ